MKRLLSDQCCVQPVVRSCEALIICQMVQVGENLQIERWTDGCYQMNYKWFGQPLAVEHEMYLRGVVENIASFK